MGVRMTEGPGPPVDLEDDGAVGDREAQQAEPPEEDAAQHTGLQEQHQHLEPTPPTAFLYTTVTYFKHISCPHIATRKQDRTHKLHYPHIATRKQDRTHKLQ